MCTVAAAWFQTKKLKWIRTIRNFSLVRCEDRSRRTDWSADLVLFNCCCRPRIRFNYSIAVELRLLCFSWVSTYLISILRRICTRIVWHTIICWWNRMTFISRVSDCPRRWKGADRNTTPCRWRVSSFPLLIVRLHFLQGCICLSNRAMLNLIRH